MNEIVTCSEEPVQPSFMVRQPIFGRDKSVWGYELVTSSMPVMADGSQASCLADFVATFRDSLAFMIGGLTLGQKIVVNISSDNLCWDQIGTADWKNCIFNLLPDAVCQPECADFIEYIQAVGGSISLDGDSRQEAFNSIVDRSDFVRLSLVGKTPPEIVAIRKKLKTYPGQFLVNGVSSWQDYEGTRALGFNFFQGSFFSIPETRKDHELSVGAVAKMQLIKELGNPDCQMNELAAIIGSDVSLSYRILKYINSAFFGLRNEISSIQQAVSLLGLKEVRHWAMVVVMSGLDTSPKGEELGFMALQRARFLSQVAEVTENFPHPSATMFMLGLFSKLDALLSYPMEKALEDVPLESRMRDGLCGVDNEFHDWLILLNAIEAGNWGVANEMLAKHKVSFCNAATQYMKASSWAAMLMPD